MVSWIQLYAQLQGMEKAGWLVSGVSAHSAKPEFQTLVVQVTRVNGRRDGKGYLAPSVPVQTSVDAANAVRPRINKMHEAILAHLEQRHQLSPVDGLTAEELESATGYSGNTIRPRLKELERMGYVTRHGGTRRTKRGQSAMVWSYVR